MSEIDGAAGHSDSADPRIESDLITEQFPAIPSDVQPAGRPRISRRALLGSAGGLVVVTLTGLGAGWSRNFGHTDRFDRHIDLPEPPEVLVRAAQREVDLIATLAATQSVGGIADAAVLRALLADHQAHAQALQGALAGYRQLSSVASPSGSGSASSEVAPASSRAELSRAETVAQAAAAADSLALSGASAALLASISACEGSHLVLLT